MTIGKLSVKQEKFAQAIASSSYKDNSDAYRACYDCSKMSKSTVNRNAKALMDNSKIITRIAELRAPAIAAVGITLESHLNELQSLRDLAKDDAKYDAAIKAEIARGKACGLYVEKHEVTGKDGAPLAVASVTKEMTAQQAAEVYQKLIKG